MYIGGQWVTTGEKVAMTPPHDHQHVLGHYHRGNASHVRAAIDAALAAKPAWEAMPWQDRAAIFLRAADLLSGPWRYRLNAATMLCQSKTCHQSEIDAVCELADFWRYGVHFQEFIYRQQPGCQPGVWNRLEYLPLEGFVFAITPFNFTAIAGNLPSAPALMGNTVVWKPSDDQIYSAWFVMRILEEAGLPKGVINLVYTDGQEAGDVIFNHPDFAGLHFTGSTGVFRNLWKTIGQNLDRYRTYPRIVGETGGKDFVLVHPSANREEVTAGLIRGAFEFNGQKCSAASRAYLPASRATELLDHLKSELQTIRQGGPEEFHNFVTAVISRRAYDKITGYIRRAQEDPQVTLFHGGKYDDSKGYFIEPTVLVTKNPHSLTMEEEIFGPVLTVYVYPDAEWDQTLELVNTTSPYALTGAVFSRDREALAQAAHHLRHAAGNLYLNDKPTGAVVNQQPFGGGRASGTNDKAGSYLNLLRWVSPRAIKDVLVSPADYRYPFLG
jgi:1-pyrroline-5-carboxylate dehydrogenase